MSISITNKQKAALRAVFTQANGQPAISFGSVPQWSAEDPSLFVITPSADGLTAELVTVDGAVGSTVVTVVVNADLSGGTREVFAQETFDMTALPEAEAAAIVVDGITAK